MINASNHPATSAATATSYFISVLLLSRVVSDLLLKLPCQAIKMRYIQVTHQEPTTMSMAQCAMPFVCAVKALGHPPNSD